MIQAAYQYAPAGRVHVFDAATLPWQDTAEPGLQLKPVRHDDGHGHFLGLVAFAPMARSGLHQHRGVATSFVVDGGLTDYHGSIALHQAGINLCGSTHDAIAYQRTVLVSRLEAPVVVAPGRGTVDALHAGSGRGDVANTAPDVPPDINIAVDALAHAQSGIAGIRRQTIFDYAGTGSSHRFVQLSLAPGAACPMWTATALTEFWVRGGSIDVAGHTAHSNCFVVIEPGASVSLASPFGALLLGWAEGPERWGADVAGDGSRAVRTSLFGFG